MSYTTDKQIIRSRANDFYLTDDLFALAELYVLAEDIFKKNEFPIKEYKKWKKKN